MNFSQIDTPALLIDKVKVIKNIKDMQEKADINNVSLRPHIKTHRMSTLAKLQLKYGAKGITVAKTKEAEVMLKEGITDIFISTVIGSKQKAEEVARIIPLGDIKVAIDSIEQAKILTSVAKKCGVKFNLLIEIEVGEKRSGITLGDKLEKLSQYLKKNQFLKLYGVYSHEGHVYGAKSVEECKQLTKKAHKYTVDVARYLQEDGHKIETISVGATPSLMHAAIEKGVTEIRPGTYILMDAAQGASLGDFNRCAATVLATIISKPTDSRIVLDSGVKALTAFVRGKGICHTPGYGRIYDDSSVFIEKIYDEHAVIEDNQFNIKREISEKVRIIPNHICPLCNLYDYAYLFDEDNITKIKVDCRGKSQ
ncbi:MAG: alanine racemase [Clostridia bacterium]